MGVLYVGWTKSFQRDPRRNQYKNRHRGGSAFFQEFMKKIFMQHKIITLSIIYTLEGKTFLVRNKS